MVGFLTEFEVAPFYFVEETFGVLFVDPCKLDYCKSYDFKHFTLYTVPYAPSPSTDTTWNISQVGFEIVSPLSLIVDFWVINFVCAKEDVYDLYCSSSAIDSA